MWPRTVLRKYQMGYSWTFHRWKDCEILTCMCTCLYVHVCTTFTKHVNHVNACMYVMLWEKISWLSSMWCLCIRLNIHVCIYKHVNYMCACMNIHTNAFMYIHIPQMHVCIHTQMHVCIYTQMHVCIYTQMCMLWYVRSFKATQMLSILYTHARMHVYMCVCARTDWNTILNILSFS